MLVVIRISEQRGVGEHDRGVAFVPVAEVVWQTHLGHHEREGGNRVSGEFVIESGEKGGRLLDDEQQNEKLAGYFNQAEIA